MGRIMILKGTVQSGESNFSYWLEKLEPLYTSKTGMKLFPGTLNVHLLEGTYKMPDDCVLLDKTEYGGTVSIRIGSCQIFGRPAFILRPGESPPESILEIAADIKLRDTYNLHDGDIVEVEVPDEP